MFDSLSVACYAQRLLYFLINLITSKVFELKDNIFSNLQHDWWNEPCLISP